MQPVEPTNLEEKPILPSKTTIGGRKLPAPPPQPITNGHTHSPTRGKAPPPPPKKEEVPEKPNHDFKMAELYTNNHFDVSPNSDGNDSDDSESDLGSPPKTKLIIGAPVGESNDDDPDDKLKNASANHASFGRAEEVLQNVLKEIDEAQQICNRQGSGASPSRSKSKESYAKAKEQLTNESRQFVTASKLFVKSATESEGQLVECLNHCVIMIERIGTVSIDVASHSPTPLQTQTLIGKVRDVADTFLQTVLAAGNATGRDMNDPSMNILMKRATNLASVLTTLMRSLRVFN